MIKSNKGRVKLWGSIEVVLAEYADIINSIRKDKPKEMKNVLIAIIEDIYNNDGDLGDETKEALIIYMNKKKEIESNIEAFINGILDIAERDEIDKEDSKDDLKDEEEKDEYNDSLSDIFNKLMNDDDEEDNKGNKESDNEFEMSDREIMDKLVDSIGKAFAERTIDKMFKDDEE